MLDRNDLIAAACAIWGDPTSCKKDEWRFGARGSKSINLNDLTWYDHEAVAGGGVVVLCERAGMTENKGNGHDTRETLYDYRDERGELLFQVVRKIPKAFFQRRPNGGGGFINDLEGVRRVPYRLPELLASSGTVFVCEGEKDADNVRALNLIATTNAGGAGKWRPEYSQFLRGRDVVILPHNDEAGDAHAKQVSQTLVGIANSIKTLHLPGLGFREDVSTWIAKGHGVDDLDVLLDALIEDPKEQAKELPPDIVLDDFYAYLPKHTYLYVPTQTLWPLPTINSRLAKIDGAKPGRWLDKNRAVSQMIWAPGHPKVVRNKHLIEGGWIEKLGAVVFNQYRQPPDLNGNPDAAGPWLDLFKNLYPIALEHEHMLDVLAFKLQHPDIKINHAIMLGGGTGIGKDTIMFPIKRALGTWNCIEARPTTIMSPFNGYMRSVLLVINEVRDLGDVKKYQFYDHMKDVIVSPPETALVNEKHEKAVHVANVCLVIMTTNHRTDGLYLPAGDRRHFVVWSDVEKESYEADYFVKLYRWLLKENGVGHVAAYLRARDVAEFDPGRPPPKTEMFHDIVEASTPAESFWIGEILNDMGRPDVLTTASIVARADGEQLIWINRNQKALPHRLEDCGYVRVGKPGSLDGRWRIGGKRENIYGRKDLPSKTRLDLASKWEAG